MWWRGRCGRSRSHGRVRSGTGVWQAGSCATAPDAGRRPRPHRRAGRPRPSTPPTSTNRSGPRPPRQPPSRRAVRRSTATCSPRRGPATPSTACGIAEGSPATFASRRPGTSHESPTCGWHRRASRTGARPSAAPSRSPDNRRTSMRSARGRRRPWAGRRLPAPVSACAIAPRSPRSATPLRSPAASYIQMLDCDARALSRPTGVLFDVRRRTGERQYGVGRRRIGHEASHVGRRRIEGIQRVRRYDPRRSGSRRARPARARQAPRRHRSCPPAPARRVRRTPSLRYASRRGFHQSAGRLSDSRLQPPSGCCALQIGGEARAAIVVNQPWPSARCPEQRSAIGERLRRNSRSR